MSTLEIFVLGGSFVIQMLTLVFSYIKLIKPQIESRTKQVNVLKDVVESLIVMKEILTQNEKNSELIIKEINSLYKFMLKKENLCSWANGGADRLTDKIAKEVCHRFRDING